MDTIILESRFVDPEWLIELGPNAFVSGGSGPVTVGPVVIGATCAPSVNHKEKLSDD